MLKSLVGPRALITALILFAAHGATAAEPAYCTYEGFMKTETQPQIQGLKRVHVFKLGNIVLAGLGVGSSPYAAVENLAREYSSAANSEGFCTWYLNKGNGEASHDFNHEYLAKPSDNSQEAANEYISKLGKYFGETRVNFLSCVEARGYLAVGCNDQKHRGPSAFGMILAYSGCSADHALNIVDRIWGLNGVKRASRLAIIQKGVDLGNAEPAQRTRLQNQFLGLAQ